MAAHVRLVLTVGHACSGTIEWTSLHIQASLNFLIHQVAENLKNVDETTRGYIQGRCLLELSRLLWHAHSFTAGNAIIVQLQLRPQQQQHQHQQQQQ